MHLCPGVTPWTGAGSVAVMPSDCGCSGAVGTLADGGGGLVEQAASSAGARASRRLRIDGLLVRDTAHLELSILDGEGEPALDEIERVLAEFLVAPAAQDVEVLAHAGGKGFEVVRPGDQARGNAGFLGADFQQQLQKIADQHAILGEAWSPRLAVR